MIVNLFKLNIYKFYFISFKKCIGRKIRNFIIKIVIISPFGIKYKLIIIMIFKKL